MDDEQKIPSKSQNEEKKAKIELEEERTTRQEVEAYMLQVLLNGGTNAAKRRLAYAK